MPWIEHHHAIPLDQSPTEGRYDLSGAVIARSFRQDWTGNKKYPLITFPSQLTRELVTEPQALTAQVHVFGALDLPFHSTRDDAYDAASSVTEEFSIPFTVKKEGENTLLLVNNLSTRGYRVVYDNSQRRMQDITRFPQEAMELLPDELRAVLPPIYTNEKIGDKAYAPVKFFTPAGSWTWYATEFDGDDTFFGLVSGFELELGYFSLSELESVRGPLGLPIERDLYYTPQTVQELRAHERQLKGL